MHSQARLIDVAQYFYQIPQYLPTDYLSVMANVSVKTDQLMLSAAFVIWGQWVDMFQFKFMCKCQSFGDIVFFMLILNIYKKPCFNVLGGFIIFQELRNLPERYNLTGLYFVIVECASSGQFSCYFKEEKANNNTDMLGHLVSQCKILNIFTIF